ncbi:MAG: AmmeMemoRadiSam system protein A [Candidatus Altiarchaeota archaeon]|nr:AmmeMemoRadiSam system protein A [Candidatus Altiarchaeota archaeon]
MSDGPVLNAEEQKYLLKLARDSIKAFLGEGKAIEEKPENANLREYRGVFVTLEEYGKLRGCIGYLGAVQPLYLAVRDNAVNAATRDPRFPPVTLEELKNIEIEISILTMPEPMDAGSPDELLEKIRPGTDGLIIEHKGRSATYLPQVWEQLPDKKEFLGSLCNKAGLSSDCWKEGGVKIFRYGVQAFREKDHL